METWFRFLFDRWQAATMFDYCVAVTVIVASGWMTSNMAQR
jgi:hypothetical protein